ncbi:MAG: Tetratricopeptide 2 repeat-containing protein [Cyanobacteria bacterium RYN_339]|nr:Tetratricopeptide 2 repeat-containing protein [Cyanobacteria bacterium RYN_339]
MKQLWLLALGCVAAGSTMWAVTAERPAPAEAHGVLAPYQLPAMGQSDPIAAIQARIAAQPPGFLELTNLAGAYIQRARATNDPAWYLLAEQAARTSVARMPSSNPGAWMALAQVALARHDFAGAQRCMDRAAVNKPVAVRPLRLTLALATGEVAEANRLADALVADAPGCAVHVQRALAREARGDVPGAIADYRWAIAREQAGAPEPSVQARAWLGRLHARHGRLAMAQDLYVEALRIAPDHAQTLGLLADAEQRLGLADAARIHYLRAKDLGLGAPALVGLGRAPEARATLQREIAEGGFGHRRELATLLLADGQAAEALALMEKEVKLRHDAPTLAAYARALLAVGRKAEARHAVARALATGVEDAALQQAAAAIALALGDDQAAAAHIREMRRIDPGFRAPGAAETGA